MTEPTFFRSFTETSINTLADWCGAKIVRGDGNRMVSGISPIENAGEHDVVFLDNRKYLTQLTDTKAAACLVSPKFVNRVPDRVVPMSVDNPYLAYAKILARFYPEGMRPLHIYQSDGINAKSCVSELALLESDVCVDAGAVIGHNVEIGMNSYIGANAVIGANCKIGRNCSIGANTTCQHTIIGDDVILHPGVRLGQDGFGFVIDPKGHTKVPQVGRVIIQDKVEIGANTTVDRGTNRDTIIGEGTKIDNLVQIGHNVVIGRNCILVSQVAVAGSVTLGDFVVIGGQTVVDGHSTVGNNTQIAAVSSVYGDLPGNDIYGGVPAIPIKQWFREVIALSKLAGTNRKNLPGK